MVGPVIRILVADDDPHVLRCYEKAFGRTKATQVGTKLVALSLELFGSGMHQAQRPRFDLVTCSQGEDAAQQAADAVEHGVPFDAVILDVRMPPGFGGIEAARRIRSADGAVPIVFVSGYADATEEQLVEQIPPASKLHMFKKPLSFTVLVSDVVSMVRDNRGGPDNES
jgi:two-component system, cell cycle sensor histidine kinase and response regulator CckA